MAHPFDDARVKLARADEHLDTLESDFHAWHKPHPKRPVVHIETDGPWHVAIYEPVTKDLPPKRLSAVCGDAVQNLRAALDYAIHALVREGGQKPTRSNAFPIISSEKDWCRRVLCVDEPKSSPLYGLDPQGKAWTIIRSAQPYMSRHPDQTRLAILSAFANRDKHHSLALHHAFPTPERLSAIVVWNPSATLLEKRIRPLGPLTLNTRAELVRVRFDPSGASPNVRVEGRFEIEPSFGDETRQATIGAFRVIRNDVSELIEQLAKTIR